MVVKAVFFDIDGTLLTDNRTVLTSTIQAINHLKKQGCLVGLATGRGPAFCLAYLAALNLDIAVCYNGQYILSRNQEVIAANALDKKDLIDLIDYSTQHRLDMSFGTASTIVGSRLLHAGIGKKGRWVYSAVKRMPKFMTDVMMAGFNQVYRRLRPRTKEGLVAELGEPIYQVMLLANRQETDKLAPQFPQFRFTRSSPFTADVIQAGMSKLKGIKAVAQHYQFDLQEVMVFGDSDNDLEMISGVGYGVAMGNALPLIKDVARYVTASNNQDGIATALSHFKLVPREATDVR